jgi:hypothetical protein
MTTKDRIKLLAEWKEQFDVCDKAWTACESVFRGLDPDSDLGKAVWGTFAKYTESVSKIIGDTDGWLNWYCWESDMGAKMFEDQEHGAESSFSKKYIRRGMGKISQYTGIQSGRSWLSVREG